MVRGVADVNVYVSALLTRHGVCSRLVELAARGAWQPVVSATLLGELRDVLAREKFSRIHVDEVERFVVGIGNIALRLQVPAPPWPRYTADPDDDYLVALALSARADVIISGDSHLAEMADPPIPVVRPGSFLRSLVAGAP